MVDNQEFIELVQSTLPKDATADEFKKYHLHIMDLNYEQKQLIKNISNYDGYIDAQAKMGLSVSVLVDSIPYACFGIFPLWKGVYECWLILDNKARTRYVPLGRSSRKIFSRLSSMMVLKRLQMYVISTNLLYKKYAEFCKFEKEGLLRAFGPEGSDYYIYSRLFK